jgi:ATP-dependent Clp protease adaptor protein ClpS
LVAAESRTMPPASGGRVWRATDWAFHQIAKSLIIGGAPGEDERSLGMSKRNDESGAGTAGQVVTKTKDQTQKPAMYKVLLLNDDYTPMEFVVHVLERIFGKSQEDATRIMLHVHNHGVGICGVYTYEIAETKVTQVVDFARQNQHPLQCTMEKD